MQYPDNEEGELSKNDQKEQENRIDFSKVMANRSYNIDTNTPRQKNKHLKM